MKKMFSSFFSVILFFGAANAQKAVPYLTEPAISVDRAEIALVSGGDIWTVAANGGAAQLLVSHPATESRPLYAPNGKILAFGSTRTGNGDIYTLNLENGEVVRVTFDDANDKLEAWSRDGEWLYFSSNSKDISGMNDIFRVRASGGTPMAVSSDRYTSEFHVAPAPNNSGDFAFAARGIGDSQWWRNGRSHIDESEIWLKTGDNYEQIAARGDKKLWTMWSADGSKIFYVSDKSGTENIWSQPLRGAAKQLTNFKDGRVLWANIAYDGREIVFERDFKIWKMDADSGKANVVNINLRGAAASPLVERIPLAGQAREMVLSPDGKKIALVARGEIFAASSKDGGEAARVTNSVAPESFVVWSPDSRKLIYVSERDGTSQLYSFDFQTETETRLVTGKNEDYAPVFSPDGKSLAFIRDKRLLMIYDVEKKTAREVCKLYVDAPPLIGKGGIAWSPDNRWLAFFTGSPETRTYANISIVAASGGAPQPVSFLANSNTGSISWSADGTFLLFDSGQRTEIGSLARVDLILRTPKFREDTFRDLFKQENPNQKPQLPNPQTSPTPTVTPTPNATPSPSPSASPSPSPKKEEPKTEIVFDNIRQRLSLIRTGIDVSSQTISPDGKSVLIAASSEGQFNLYVLPLDELATDFSAKQLTSTSGFKSEAQFSPDGKDVYFLENGRSNVVSVERREVRPLAVNMEINVNFAQEKMEVFKQGWRWMRDNFYDDKFHGVDWNAQAARFEPLMMGAKTTDEARRLMAMMVGELNASHLGVTPPPNPANAPTPVGKTGLRFDRAEFENNGRLKITEIIALSPAEIIKNIKVGDYLTSVDGAKISRATNLDEIMQNKVGRRVVLSVSTSPDGTNPREAVIKPISTGAEKNLLYRQWVEASRAYVERISGGKLGYVHLPDMSADTLAQLYVDLDTQNQSKTGVVIDVRNNNGGFINPYVVDVLSRRGYLTFKTRGEWNVPGRSALGQRSLELPTVLVTNQHSLSDAEDLTEGYRALKLGKVVGEPTAGWIVFTWTLGLFDNTTFRLPRTMITGVDGKNMELNPRPVDVAVTRPIGESLQNRDSQLDRAVRELNAQIGNQ